MERRLNWRFFLAYVPGGLICLAYLVSFYLHRGWLLHNPVSWIENNQLADVIGILRNVVVFAWRLADFGRITIYLFFLYFIFCLFKNRVLIRDVKLLYPLLFACSFLVIFFPLLVIYRNPFGHRYLMPLIIMVTLITLVWILKYSKFIKTLSLLILFSLLIGHFIIYPEKISMGWDSTTAHWPYYRLRKEMIHYIEDENIPFSTIASFFPNLRETTLIDPDDLTHNFNPDIMNSQYVFYSNVYNVNDEVIDELHNSKKWILIKEYSNLSIFVRFYKRCPAY